MAKEHDIVCTINEALDAATTSQKFTGKQYAGITILRKNSDNQIIPVEYAKGNVSKLISINDAIPLQWYHRNNGSVYVQSDKRQYGNSNSALGQTTNMSLIVMANFLRTGLYAEEIEGIFVAGIPTILTEARKTELNLRACTIGVNSCSHESVALFEREHKGNYMMNENTIIFEIRYQIVTAFFNECINACD